MSSLDDVFADSVFWIALIVRNDQHHSRARQWSQLVNGRIVTTSAVLLETANALSRPAWRSSAIALIDHISTRSDVDIVETTDDLWNRGWKLYCGRPDKGWSLTDCMSFVVMEENELKDALTADEHFRQAGFRAVLLEEPG
jgi:uncharacterized protein